VPLGKELVPVLYDLVSTADELEVVPLQEPRDHISSKLDAHKIGIERSARMVRQILRAARARGWTYGERDSTVVLTPTGDVLVRVRPEQVAQETSVWHVRRSHDPSDLLHRLEIR
jgi:hypothetical protein